jgi:hypothetical protein
VGREEDPEEDEEQDCEQEHDRGGPSFLLVIPLVLIFLLLNLAAPSERISEPDDRCSLAQNGAVFSTTVEAGDELAAQAADDLLSVSAIAGR